MWKTFAGKCIYNSPSGIQVFQNPLFRWLKFENSSAIQTLINKHYPRKPELHYINPLTLFVQIQPANCCMLGLGGGGAAHAIAICMKNSKLTVVEHSAEVIDVARHFFMINKINNLKIVNQDAKLFVERTEMTFPHILVDLYNSTTFPAACCTEDFFYNCKERLLDQGILAVNLANKSQQWSIFQLIRKHFLNATIAIPVKNSANIILFAIKNASVTTLIDILKKHKKFNQLYWDTHWGTIAKIKN
ncbi:MULTISPECIES: spermidine synthase [unclassified Legionella]|uniref:spermidine synthase n=1 Tax=unclassified Legionella TaxID=2622702 RepID=UPI0010565B4E|nr:MULTISPECIES: fused MFS/spermidine synthase [unclassified Legionella]MDI9818414.1 fused MFS/spermidine synthase [Legionella sp. PL877]